MARQLAGIRCSIDTLQELLRGVVSEDWDKECGRKGQGGAGGGGDGGGGSAPPGLLAAVVVLGLTTLLFLVLWLLERCRHRKPQYVAERPTRVRRT